MRGVQMNGGDGETFVLLFARGVSGPAVVAQALYRETDMSRLLRLKLAEERKAMPPVETSRRGKPSKRDRRELSRLRGS